MKKLNSLIEISELIEGDEILLPSCPHFRRVRILRKPKPSPKWQGAWRRVKCEELTMDGSKMLGTAVIKYVDLYYRHMWLLKTEDPEVII